VPTSLVYDSTRWRATTDVRGKESRTSGACGIRARGKEAGITLIFQDSTSAGSRFDSQLVVNGGRVCVFPFYGHEEKRRLEKGLPGRKKGGGCGTEAGSNERGISADISEVVERFVCERESPSIYTLSTSIHPPPPPPILPPPAVTSAVARRAGCTNDIPRLPRSSLPDLAPICKYPLRATVSELRGNYARREEAVRLLRSRAHVRSNSAKERERERESRWRANAGESALNPPPTRAEKRVGGGIKDISQCFSFSSFFLHCDVGVPFEIAGAAPGRCCWNRVQAIMTKRPL